MKKYKILINNLEHVAFFLGVSESKIKYTDLTHPFAKKFSKHLSKRIPLRPDTSLITKFENTTGLKLAYNIFSLDGNYDILDKNGLRSNLDNTKTRVEADIIVIDKNYQRGWI